MEVSLKVAEKKARFVCGQKVDVTFGTGMSATMTVEVVCEDLISEGLIDREYVLRWHPGDFLSLSEDATPAPEKGH